MAESTQKRVIHVRAAHDFLGAPALLVAGIVPRELPAYARARVPGGVSVPLEWGKTLDALLAPLPRCAACAACAACPAWDWAALADYRVTPRAEGCVAPRAPEANPPSRFGADEDARAAAMDLLDLSDAEAASPDAIRAAYRRAALRAHPDRGGSDEEMARVSAARDLLLKTLW